MLKIIVMKKVTVVGALILVTAYYYWNQRYVQFFPVVEFDGDGYVTASSSPDADFYNNLAFVLSYYDVDFKQEKNTIWVKYATYKEKDMCYNYTKKANDPIWRSSR